MKAGIFITIVSVLFLQLGSASPLSKSKPSKKIHHNKDLIKGDDGGVINVGVLGEFETTVTSTLLDLAGKPIATTMFHLGIPAILATTSNGRPMPTPSALR